MSEQAGSTGAGASSTIKVTIKVPQEIGHHAAVSGKKNSKSQSHGNNGNEMVFQFSKESKVQTIVDILAYAQSTKYLTNIELRTAHRVLKNEESLLDVVGDAKATSLNLDVQLKPYNTREVIKNLITFRDFIGFSVESVDGISDFAISSGSKFSSLPLNEIKEKQEETEEVVKEGEQPKKNVMHVSAEEQAEFAKVVREIFELKTTSDISKTLSSNSNLIQPCVNSLSLSAYNPVPAFYRTEGHLCYLHLVTIEGESFHITATPAGFYMNKSTSNKFDPSMKEFENVSKENSVKYSLFDLIASHSKKFKAHVDSLEQKLTSHQSVEYVRPITTFLNKPWLISSIPPNAGDFARTQLSSFEFEIERNFNDEFQAVQELGNETIQDTIQAEKLSSRISHDFTVAATKGAMSIFYGDLVALNPESEDDQIFLKDNIFYSFVSDVTGTYKDKGGDEAAAAAANQDLKTLKYLKNLHLRNIHYLLTTIVEYGGKKILAQTPVPGLLSNMGTEIVKDQATGEEIVNEKRSEVVVQHGYDEDSGKVIADEKFDKDIKSEISKLLHLKTHTIDGKEISFSSQSKGIVGSDKRKYIIDLANTNPLDISFVKKYYDIEDESKRYPHRQTLLRTELIEKWWNSKINKEGISTEKAYEENKYAYNPDAYQVAGVEDSIVDELSTYLIDEVIPSVVNEYTNGNIGVPYNGEHLVDTMHTNGINVRYLGKVAELAKEKLNEQELAHEKRLKEIAVENKDYEEWEAAYLQKIEKMVVERQEKINKLVEEGKEVPEELKKELKLDESEIRKATNEQPSIPNKEELQPLVRIAELEMFSRATKHVIRKYTKSLPVTLIPSLLAYIYNILFGHQYNESSQVEDVDKFNPVSKYEFSKLTRESLLAEISKQVLLRYRYELPSNFVDLFDENPFALVRALSIKSGVQLLNKKYFFTKDQAESYKQTIDKKFRSKFVEPINTFQVSDFTVIPLVKGLDYSSILSQEKWAEGSMHLSQNQNTALTLFAQSIAIIEDVNGVLHPDVAEKYLTLSTIYSKLGLIAEAVAFCRKSCTIYERVCGIDSFEMLRALSNLALLEFTNEAPYNAALVFKRIIETIESYNLTQVFRHPALMNAYNQLEQMSLGIQDVKLTIEICKKYLELLASGQDGDQSLAYATLQSRLGNLYATLKDFQHAMEHIAKTPSIFTKELGTNHQITAQSRQWVLGLSNLIQDARQKKKLDAEKAAVQSGKKPTKSKKAEINNPALVNKSVDELLQFIEGESVSKKSKSSKKSSKK